ncbi:hypothetical protein [Microbacterium sp.]|uniref:hypothetical protein n=1 Tax=Microbacterium sp. TaxID=51671 RepID=UPI0039E3BBD3
MAVDDLDNAVTAALDKVVRDLMAQGHDYLVVWKAIERVASSRGALPRGREV